MRLARHLDLGHRMNSPSPSDHCWTIGFTPQGRWIAPAVRAATRVEWPQAKQIASAHLGDETLVHELMELAVLQTGEHLADLPPIGVEEVRKILARFYRNAVRRRQRANNKFSFRGTASELEVLASSRDTALPALEAELDLQAILRETPPDLRRAMLMRYGAHTPWGVIARETSNSKEAIRKRCQRELDRIRRKLGIGEQVG